MPPAFNTFFSFCQAKSGGSRIIVRFRDCPWQEPAQLSPPHKGSIRHPRYVSYHYFIYTIHYSDRIPRLKL